MKTSSQSQSENPTKTLTSVVTSPSSGFKYGRKCHDCKKSLPKKSYDRYETLSRSDNAPVLLCHDCYRKRGNDVR
jgi:hypothetical protein